MQLFFSDLEEGNVKGLDIISGQVKKLKAFKDFRVPHMGWAPLEINLNNTKLLNGITDHDQFYFVHSFATPENSFITSYVKNNNNHTKIIFSESNTSNQNYCTIPATVEFRNYYGAQFHPEKSGLVGETILKNFLNQVPIN